MCIVVFFAWVFDRFVQPAAQPKNVIVFGGCATVFLHFSVNSLSFWIQKTTVTTFDPFPNVIVDINRFFRVSNWPFVPDCEYAPAKDLMCHCMHVHCMKSCFFSSICLLVVVTFIAPRSHINQMIHTVTILGRCHIILESVLLCYFRFGLWNSERIIQSTASVLCRNIQKFFFG